MAKIGCKYLTVALITSYTDGSAPTYGTKTTVEYLNSIGINFEYASAELYGDDMLRESEKSLIGYSASANLTDLAPAIAAAFLGWEKKGDGDGYVVKGVNSPYVGFGMVTCGMVNGVKYYEGYWFYRSQFSKDSLGAATKEKNVTFNTDAISGTGMGCVIDTSGEPVFYEVQRFAAEADAKSFMESFVK